MGPNIQQEQSGNVSSFVIQPTTSTGTDRYDKSGIVSPAHTTIPALFHYDRGSEPLYLPAGWFSHIHPEGQLYFCTNTRPRIVTEAYLYNDETMDKIAYAAKWMEDLISQRNISLSNDVELFLQLDDKSDAISYYFIDHHSRTQFWIDQMPTQLLNLPPVVSNSHLKLVLEEHYWNHVANFPMHFGGLSTQTVDELIGVFLHGRADRLTSKVSTFPYGAAECANFLDLLKASRDDISSGYSTCLVARLWSFIVSNRFGTHYGQQHVRLSRDQAILVESGSPKHLFFTSASRLFFGAPDMYTSLFDKIFVDDLVYEDQWRIFMSTCREDWKMSLYWAFPLLMSNIIMSFVKMASPALTIATCLVCSMSILAGMHLLVQHQELADSSASLAVQYLQANRSNTFGFQHMALIFSLPKALCLWSLGFFVAHWIFIAARMVSTATAVAYVVLLFVLALGVRQGIVQEQEPECSPRPRCYFARLFSRFSPDDANAPEMVNV